MAKAITNANMASILARSILSSWYGKIPLIVLTASVAGLAYWHRETLAASIALAEESVLSRVGLGAVVIALWVGAVAFGAAFRHSLMRRPRLWLASPLIVLFALGALSYLAPYQGALAYFTLEGEHTLGGSVGYAIAGDVAWQGVIRLAALIAVAVLIAAPSGVPLVGRALMALYMYSFGAALWLSGKLSKRDEQPSSDAAALDTAAPMKGRWSESLREALEAPELKEGVKPQTWRGGESLEDFGAPSSLVKSPLPAMYGDSSFPAPAEERVDTEETYADDMEDAEDGQGPLSESGMDSVRIDAEFHDPFGDAEYGSAAAVVDEDDGSEAPPENIEADEDAQSPFDSGEVAEDGGQSHDPLLDNEPPAPPPALSARGNVEWRNPVHDAKDEADADRKFNSLWGGVGAEPAPAPADEAPRAPSSGGMGSMVRAIIGGPDVSAWGKPSLGMFVDANEGGISQQEIDHTARTIRETLGHYGVEVEVEDTRPGPTVTMYGLVPGWIRRQKQINVLDENGRMKLDDNGRQMRTREETKTRVKVDAITAREKDLSLALKTPSIRIETPVMGKSLVGVEVPNPNPALVTLRNVMQDRVFRALREKAKLPVAIGKGGSGETVAVDLAKMPHLLVAGSTGSGKSVFINTLIACLLIENDPSDLRLLLVDPKRVELTPYNGIPHLLTPVVVETDQVVGLLRGLIKEMMDRYRSMEELGVRNIDSYNRKNEGERMPHLVVAVDELADLMMTASVDVEQALCRLAQLGRATGIHLIVATQRPSVDVLTGLIKANFPSRVSFALTSQIDSRTILDASGAEKLLGKGDMLYQSVDMSRAERVQGVFISDQEIDNLVSFWKDTPRGPMREITLEAMETSEAAGRSAEDDNSDDRDDLIDKAIELASRQKKLSTSLLQRRMRIGYPRAARLMDQLEEEGIVGPSDGSKSRDVILG